MLISEPQEWSRFLSHEMPTTLTWSQRYGSAMGACSIATQWREVLGLLKDADSLTVGLGQVLCDNRVVLQQVRKAQLFSAWMIRQQHIIVETGQKSQQHPHMLFFAHGIPQKI